MPDVHIGKGATIGTVFASSNYVCPNAVGVDIGCGMCAVPVDGLSASKSGKVLNQAQREAIFKLIKEEIPTGFEAYDKPLKGTVRKIEELTELQRPTKWLVSNIGTKAKCQLGTLGGGNHFLEVLADETDRIWLMLHSGSRHIGKHTAEFYNNVAIEQMNKLGDAYGNKRNVKQDLNYLRIDTEEGQAYLSDMQWCQSYAYNNRQAMMERMADIVQRVTGEVIDTSKAINIHHNYCTCETCDIFSDT